MCVTDFHCSLGLSNFASNSFLDELLYKSLEMLRSLSVTSQIQFKSGYFSSARVFLSMNHNRLMDTESVIFFSDVFNNSISLPYIGPTYCIVK